MKNSCTQECTAFLKKNKLLNQNQLGFTQNHSTSHALINLTETIKRQLDEKKLVAGVFIDLEKAFDTVNHSILREKLALLQQIPELQNTLNPSGIQTAVNIKHVKVPEGLYTMYPTEYRTYENDCRAFANLTGFTNYQIVSQLRLHMDPDMKRIIDTNHPSWSTSTPDQALSIIKNIVYETSNPCVYRKQFDSMVQKKNESIREFITNLRVCALDCAFTCPYDESHGPHRLPHYQPYSNRYI